MDYGLHVTGLKAPGRGKSKAPEERYVCSLRNASPVLSCRRLRHVNLDIKGSNYHRIAGFPVHKINELKST